MDFITVNNQNIDTEHICCVMSDKKGENCVASKKAWLKERFNDGLIFLKANVRGKAFIEFIPAEKAWCPILANNYMFINCLWVSGKYKGQGISNILLEKCIKYSKENNKLGLVILSSNKKIPFLSDPKYLKYKGFKVCDNANPNYELLYLPFNEKAYKPKFKDCAKNGTINKNGLVLYYSNQCPYTDKYTKIIKDLAENNNKTIKLIKFKNTKEAQNSPSPFTTYSFFYNGKFITNEILSEKKFLKFLENNVL